MNKPIEYVRYSDYKAQIETMQAEYAINFAAAENRWHEAEARVKELEGTLEAAEDMCVKIVRHEKSLLEAKLADTQRALELACGLEIGKEAYWVEVARKERESNAKAEEK